MDHGVAATTPCAGHRKARERPVEGTPPVGQAIALITLQEDLHDRRGAIVAMHAGRLFVSRFRPGPEAELSSPSRPLEPVS
jgi:hypothetical protein